MCVTKIPELRTGVTDVRLDGDECFWLADHVSAVRAGPSLQTD